MFFRTGLATNPKIGYNGKQRRIGCPLGPTEHFRQIYIMDHSHTTSRQQGLTLAQWGLLVIAFVLGVGSSFIVREIFPPVHAGVIQSAPISSATVR